MAVKPPQQLAKVVNQDTGLSMMEVEMQAEAATSLGHHGRKTEAALKALAEADDENRDAAIRKASREVWAYFIQRELMGMRDHRLIIREMGIPDIVLRRMGEVC